jgi:hypothetical protein
VEAISNLFFPQAVALEQELSPFWDWLRRL